MINSQPAQMSTRMALDGLKELAESIKAQEQALEESKALRDEMLIDLADLGIPMSKLARLVGLTRERVGKIASPRRRVSRGV